MKNRVIAGTITIITGFLVAVGPQTLFKICDQSHHGGVSTCFWTGRALIGVGIVFALLGIAYLFFRDTRLRAGLSLAAAANVVLTFLLANLLIGMDPDPMMACRIATLPALNIISVLALIFAVINTLYLLRVKEGGSGHASLINAVSGH